jgi:hypothetical protein
MTVEFWIALPREKYDRELGWSCTALDIPGAKLVELRMAGETIVADKVTHDASHIRFVNSPKSGLEDAAVKIRLIQQ